jgi:hypothetical protein
MNSNSSSLPILQHYIINKGEQLMNSSSLPILQHYITNKEEQLMNSSSLLTLQHYITNKGEVGREDEFISCSPLSVI